MSARSLRRRETALSGLPSGIRLIGLGGGELEGLLGRPTLVRSERQAQYWRYSLGECQLDLFLYAEPASALSRVVYLDVRPSGYAPSGAGRDVPEARRRYCEASRYPRAGPNPTAAS